MDEKETIMNCLFALFLAVVNLSAPVMLESSSRLPKNFQVPTKVEKAASEIPQTSEDEVRCQGKK